ncbi:TPA: N-acetyltransferase 9 [Trebouxia sp. C0004]
MNFSVQPECTFILLDPALPDTEGTGQHGGGMIGDVNLFLNDVDEPSVAEIEVTRSQMHCKHMQLVLTHLENTILLHQCNSATRNQTKSVLWPSIQIMIAVKASRRKGLAFEALTIFMAYAVKYLAHKLKIGQYGHGTQASALCPGGHAPSAHNTFQLL